jgi:hypothetical protein
MAKKASLAQTIVGESFAVSKASAVRLYALPVKLPDNRKLFGGEVDRGVVGHK